MVDIAKLEEMEAERIREARLTSERCCDCNCLLTVGEVETMGCCSTCYWDEVLSYQETQ